MTISILGSMSSIIGLILVSKAKNPIKIVKPLLTIIVCLSVATSYLIYENNRITSQEYRQAAESFQEQLSLRSVEREAEKLYAKFPSVIDEHRTGENEGIVYSTLALLERNKDRFPELFSSFKRNILEDIDSAKSIRGSSEHRQILADAAEASKQVVRSLQAEDNI